ncbi:ABC transporter permease [Halosegnis marinus]|uniref:ABC transporter permease n=1 Tax=Halosegnis marinus TaxID=3034023 RepID=A0ABD5ZJU8_9EURY|nr:ABC transporter permease [Halosegnis sp. DT85]
MSDLRERGERALARLVEASAAERFAISFAALVCSVLVGTAIILVSGRVADCTSAAFVLTHPAPFGLPRLFSVGFCYDPIAVYDRLFLGALGDPLKDGWGPLTPFSGGPLNPFREGWNPLNRQIAVTLRETTVLIFTGLSVAVAFRAGVFNIGTQGQLVVGGLASALAVLAAAPYVSGLVGTLVLVPLALVVGALGGGAYGAIPGLLKAYADANEVITTIMLNFVATGVVGYLVLNHFKDPESAATQTRSLPEYADFPALLFDPRNDFSILALLVGVAVVAGVYYLLTRTSFGYDLRTSGLQPEAAEYGGVDAKRTVVTSFALSGALGGIAGALYVVMILGQYQTGVPSYGFDGITVSILAGNNPLGVGFAALLFGVLKSGTVVVDFATDVPPQLVGVLRGLIILFVAMPEFFRLLGRRAESVQRRVGRGANRVAADGGRGGENDE